MTLRASRILAVARRDLAMELTGRRALTLPSLMGILLLPVALIRAPNAGSAPPPMIPVTGEVPASVLEIPQVRPVSMGHANLWFRKEPDGLVIQARFVPEPVRERLEHVPAVAYEDVRTIFEPPSRSLLFALVSASVLTGAVAQSLPGERSRRTLDALLSAAITRGELVIGKWSAWAIFGAASALAASILALVLGRVSIGPWLLPLPLVPACTVALGLFLVRRTSDVVSGATVSLRVLPALLASAGIAAWLLGRVHPLLGAALPLGGAVLASGAAWPGVLPALLASVTTAATTLFFLWKTARDLSNPGEAAGWPAFAEALPWLAVGASCWLAPTVGPALWAAGGNPALAADLPKEPALLAGGLLLGLAALVGAARSTNILDSLGLRAPASASIAWVIPAVLALFVVRFSVPYGPNVGDFLPSFLGDRLGTAFHLAWSAPSVLAIVGQELFFRGYVQRRSGALLAGAFAFLATASLDPVTGLLSTVILGALVRRTGTVLSSLVARVLTLAICSSG